jgi:hypothetical protein
MNDFFSNDPMLSSMRREQGQIIEEYKRRVETQGTRTPIWDKIDAEMTSLTDKQKEIVFKDEDYVAVNNELSVMVQTYLLNLVKPQIEANENGRKMLEKVYDNVVLAKKKAVNETEKEMELFKKWRTYSASNPDATYSEFLKSTSKKK